MNNAVLNWLGAFAVLGAGVSIVYFVPAMHDTGIGLAGAAVGWFLKHLSD